MSPEWTLSEWGASDTCNRDCRGNVGVMTQQRHVGPHAVPAREGVDAVE